MTNRLYVDEEAIFFGLSTSLRYVDIKWLIFLIRHLYLIGVWLGEDKRTNNENTINTNNVRRLDYLLKVSLTTPHSNLVDTTRTTYIFR